MFGFGDPGLRRQKSHLRAVRERLADLESRGDFTETKRLFASVWRDHPQEQEFYIKLARSREIVDLSEQQLRMAKKAIPGFDKDLELVEQALRECQQYIENLIMTLTTRQALSGGGDDDA